MYTANLVVCIAGWIWKQDHKRRVLFLTLGPQYITRIYSSKPKAAQFLSLCRATRHSWSSPLKCCCGSSWQVSQDSVVFPCSIYTTDGFQASEIPLVGFTLSNFRYSIWTPYLQVSSYPMKKSRCSSRVLERNQPCLWKTLSNDFTDHYLRYRPWDFWRGASHSASLCVFSNTEPFTVQFWLS